MTIRMGKVGPGFIHNKYCINADLFKRGQVVVRVFIMPLEDNDIGPFELRMKSSFRVGVFL